jgi:hypothetical protein
MKMKKKANQLVIGDIVAGFGGGAKVISTKAPYKTFQYHLPKVSLVLENVKDGKRRNVLWGWDTTISMKSIVGLDN